MKSLIKLPLLVLLAVFTFSCSTDSIDDKADELAAKLVVPETKTIEIEIMELINNHRLTNGLSPLSSMDIIKSQAYSHTDYMVDNDEVSHANFFTRKNYLVNHAAATSVSENVAYGYTSAQSVVNAWLNSEGHRKNIEGNYTNFDISAEKNAEGNWYYTNIFIKK